jgi:hypothetical protein
MNPNAETVFYSAIGCFIAFLIVFISSAVDQLMDGVKVLDLNMEFNVPTRKPLTALYFLSGFVGLALFLTIISTFQVEQQQMVERAKASQVAEIHATQVYLQSFLKPTEPPANATETAVSGQLTPLAATEQALLYGTPTPTAQPTAKDDGTGILLVACIFGWICH